MAWNGPTELVVAAMMLNVGGPEATAADYAEGNDWAEWDHEVEPGHECRWAWYSHMSGFLDRHWKALWPSDAGPLLCMGRFR